MIEVLAMEDAEFFAPVSSDLIDSLIGQHHSMRQRIEELYAAVTGEMAGAMQHALEGNRDPDRTPPSVGRLFSEKGKAAAIKDLDAGFWTKALHLTDVLNYMPQARRDAWNKQLTAWRESNYVAGKKPEEDLPPFEEQTVRGSLQGLMAMRSQFLAERVDGIFRGLSGEHVTNSPAAFGKRMIVSRVLNDYCGYAGYSTCGLINDLRCVIAKFMGRDEPGYNASSGLISSLRGNWGQWVTVDGGALKIRLYMKGTAHIEVHPDMAWRLNATLAHMHPMAIPPEFRTKPKRKAKEIALIQRPLPFAVIDLLASLKQASRHVPQPENWRNPMRFENVRNALKFEHGSPDKHAKAEACVVLESIGGAWSAEGWWQFDYDAHGVIDEIVASGCIPDQKAFQFYGTPDSISETLIEFADIQSGARCLEPSAGLGSIAARLPTDSTTCIEVSALRCAILRAKGLTTIEGDFLALSESLEAFDRIVMNPPFDQGRALAHIEAAAALLAPGGRIVAVAPMGLLGKVVLPGVTVTWPRTFHNEFAGTSISVAVMVGVRS